MKKINLLLIGFGPHAKRIYYPICKSNSDIYNIQLTYAVDLEEKRTDITKFLAEKNDEDTKIYFIQPQNRTYNKLSSIVEKKLNQIVDQHKITGVIISTEPRAHTMYGKWALKKGINVLMDKPISTHENISTDSEIPKKLLQDYQMLKKTYIAAKRKYKRLYFSLMSQRRWHPAFKKVRELIKEVNEKTNCPITSIQTFHSDGQFRFPSEIIDIDYHGFNKGFGKVSHSGYHFLDIVTWLLEAGENREKSIDNVDIFTNSLRPNDFLSQINLSDYGKIFPNFKKYNKYSQKKINIMSKKYGELDSFSSLAFKHGNQTITLASVNLIHNGFSKRSWLSVENRDLYKGNGRLRHESHFIEQGPFQAISLISYQSNEINPKEKKNLYNVGDEYHLDIHVFRNADLFQEWKTYEFISIKDLTGNIMDNRSRGHQEDARRKAVLEFIKFLNGEKINPTSDLLDHERSTQLIYGIYKSAANRFNKKNPLINVPFRRTKNKI